jgi:excisionase family DNA binding protein
VATTLLDRSGQCTYRNTYVRFSRSCAPFLVASESHLDWRRGAKSASLCVMAGIRYWGLVKFAYLRRRRSTALHLVGERISSSVTTINFQTRELNKLLYSVSEVAVLLSCSRNTVYAFIRSGELLAVHPTSRARISASALHRFIQGLEEKARRERDIQTRRFR